MRVLYISEIVGKAGIWCVKSLLPALKNEYSPDVIVANADGATLGHGLGRQHAGYLLKLGIHALTGGDCLYYKKDLVDGFSSLPRVVRPANYPVESPGRGWRMVQTAMGNLAVVSLLGQVHFLRVHSDNPFTALDAISLRLRAETPFVLIDYHAAATAEKLALALYADTKVSAVIGSHGRVQTADACVLSGGTGIITDAGRTGSRDSVGGTAAEPRISEYLTGVPEWSRECWASPVLQGVVLELDSKGRCASISSFSRNGTIPEQELAKIAAQEGV